MENKTKTINTIFLSEEYINSFFPSNYSIEREKDNNDQLNNSNNSNINNKEIINNNNKIILNTTIAAITLFTILIKI